MNFFRDRKLEVYFCVNYLYSKGSIGYVDLSDFNETWPKCLSDISAPKNVWLLRKSKCFIQFLELLHDLCILKCLALKCVLIFSIRNHLCSFMLYYYLFGIFPS